MVGTPSRPNHAYLLANVGDTLTHATTTNIEPLPGFKPMQSMVFAGVFPLDAQDFQKLEEAIGRVCIAFLERGAEC